MSFDPETFMQTTVDQANDTKPILIPEGDDFVALIKEVKGRKLEANNGNPERLIADINFDVTDERVTQVTKREHNTARMSLFLDTTPEGNLDMSKGMNVGLGRLREAVRQNQPGRAWSFGMLVGQAVRVQIKHRMVPDKEDPYVDVKMVLPL